MISHPSSYDQSLGFIVSFVFHAALLLVGGSLLVRPAEYAVELGSGGLEVHLVAANQESSEALEETLIMEEAKQAASLTAETKTQENSPTPGKDASTFHSSGGAMTEAKPNYLRNPAPVYPRQARQKGWQGVVVLRVSVSAEGRATQVEKEISSGYDVLDRSAIQAVKSWRFLPARIGELPVNSTARVPVRFKLE